MINSSEAQFIRVYITGYGRSGSSALDKLICHHFNFVGLGEVKYLYNPLFRGDKCSCGQHVNSCDFWSNAPSYWADQFKDYVNFVGAIGTVDSSKTTLDGRQHFYRALRDPDTKFIEIQRCYTDVMKSILNGAHNRTDKPFSNFQLARLARATINLCWTRLLFLMVLRNRSLLITQELLKKDPRKVVSQISEYLEISVDRQSVIEHQVAGNPLFHK